MPFSFSRHSLSGEKIESRPSPLGGKPALTRPSLPDFRAANRKMVDLKSTEKEWSRMETCPLSPLANNIVADLKMGQISYKKSSPIVRYERIKHLVIPVFVFLNRHG